MERRNRGMVIGKIKLIKKKRIRIDKKRKIKINLRVKKQMKM